MAGSGWSGDTRQLAALVTRLQRAGRGELARALATATRQVVQQQIEAGFRAGRDPAGNPWPRTVGGAPPLVGSGRLLGSISASLSSDGVAVRAGAAYAAVQQRGARIRPKRARFLRFRLANGQFVTKRVVVIPKRPFLPTGALSAQWKAALNEAASGALSRFLG